MKMTKDYLFTRMRSCIHEMECSIQGSYHNDITRLERFNIYSGEFYAFRIILCLTYNAVEEFDMLTEDGHTENMKERYNAVLKCYEKLFAKVVNRIKE